MKKYTRILSAILALPLFLSALTSCVSGGETHRVKVDVKDHGSFTLELYGDKAPITVNNFLKLVKSGYYDGLTFNRMQAGFVLQGGQGAETDTIKGEFSLNGVSNTISHKKGVISMARSNSYNSASSQFFIMLADNAMLDGGYAAFGCVVEGMDVIEEICESIPSQAFQDYQFCFLYEQYQPVIEKMTVIY